MQARQRVRFFELADACLASGMVPAYTAAAFIKRFARLALTSIPTGDPELLQHSSAVSIPMRPKRAAAEHVDLKRRLPGLLRDRCMPECS